MLASRLRLRRSSPLAAPKIEANVDEVAAALLRRLDIAPPPPYDPARDALFQHAAPPFPGEPSAPWTFRSEAPAAAAAAAAAAAEEEHAEDDKTAASRP